MTNTERGAEAPLTLWREWLDDFAPRLAIIMVVLMLAFIAWDIIWAVGIGP